MAGLVPSLPPANEASAVTLDDFDILSKVGEGGFGKVCLARKVRGPERTSSRGPSVGLSFKRTPRAFRRAENRRRRSFSEYRGGKSSSSADRVVVVVRGRCARQPRRRRERSTEYRSGGRGRDAPADDPRGGLSTQVQGGSLHALKAVRKARVVMAGDQAVKHAIDENHILQNLAHPFVVTLQYAFQDKHTLYLARRRVGGRRGRVAAGESFQETRRGAPRPRAGGDESRRRRGRDADIRKETSRGGAAAATRIFRRSTDAPQVTNWVGGGDLSELLKRDRFLPEYRVRFLAAQLAAAVTYRRPSGELARWSCFCYVLQEDHASSPTLQESVKTVLVRPRSDLIHRYTERRRRAEIFFAGKF